MRAVVYTRYSSDHQREASIDDQIRLCTSFSEGQGWTVAKTYSDQAISGASLLRVGYQSLLEEARWQTYDVLVAEGLDRLSRDQADIATLFKHLAFQGCASSLLRKARSRSCMFGLKGTMNGLYLKNLAIKDPPRSGGSSA